MLKDIGLDGHYKLNLNLILLLGIFLITIFLIGTLMRRCIVLGLRVKVGKGSWKKQEVRKFGSVHLGCESVHFGSVRVRVYFG